MLLIQIINFDESSDHVLLITICQFGLFIVHSGIFFSWNLIGGMISTLCHRCLAGKLRCEMINTNHLDLSSLDV